MSVSKTEEKKCRAIQVMKDAGYVNNLYYITLLLQKKHLEVFRT